MVEILNGQKQNKLYNILQENTKSYSFTERKDHTRRARQLQLEVSTKRFFWMQNSPNKVRSNTNTILKPNPGPNHITRRQAL